MGFKGVFVKPKIVLTGGGTAGHVWPHFALFDSEESPLKRAFCADELEVHYFGSKTGLERQLVQSINPKWHYHMISTGKFRRYFSLKNLVAPFKVFAGFWRAFWILQKLKPFVVFSKGGFVSAPVVWAAWLNHIPVVIHESDVTPALATKLTLPFCQKILCAFSETIKYFPKKYQKKARTIGLPLRTSLFKVSKLDGRAHFKFKNEKQVILIFGGSLGARGLNKNIFEVLPQICQKYNVIHITGKSNKISEFKHNDYKQFEFLNNEMAFAYAASDLAICRAGASSIFELACARIPMILIPLGLQASRGDQIINAQVFTKKGWAQSYEESKFKGDLILATIEKSFKILPEKIRSLNSAPSLSASHEVANILFEFNYESSDRSSAR